MKKWLLMAGTVAAMSLGLAQQLRIVVVTHGQASDPFWSVVKNGVEQGGKDVNVQVEYRAPDTFNMVRMAQLIDAAVASRPDGLVVSIPDASALGKSIEAAVKAGIPVISINSGADVAAKLGVLLHVGQEEYVAGQGAGKRMKAAGVKNALCVNQEVGNVGLDQRCKGFADGLGGKVTVLPVKLSDPTGIKNAVSAALQKDPSIDGILTLGPTAAEPTLQALEASGKLGKIQFGTFDLSPAVLKALSEKKMDFAIDQQQWLQGYLPIVFLANYKRYGLLPANEIIYTGPGFVTPQNAAQVIELSKKGIR
ncbi:sugar ABC transporter substrate-binding protein [Meiothermus granaticius]|uniref:Rhamnose ABC transporter, rhamnose-binding protein n=1 Tax=Meiothermus granaticius NBRC 107808 TaxID=1227551 RepID=A0A399F5N0_9DEIN|nr:sugar ABC transporter substrate-binding protein [Meiothermus granaticius]RIH91538.1 rhamnose ABC transporter, rhamnose-binding protein [Meiothermus granaticius NBRC 107808]GEM86963.1 sugar ABC transporter substrate-binding protein [Meiothermus granaticius NBRC 107808]